MAGAYELVPTVHSDERGQFHEWFRADVLRELTGRSFSPHADAIAQGNASVSHAGTLRGIHFAQVPPGQAKYVTCFTGAVLDVVVDLRTGSPTFGQWDSVVLDDVERRCVWIPEGLGHAFLALDDNSLVSYLCSTGYSPGREHAITPFDTTIGVEWPTHDRHGTPLSYRLSDRDRAAQTLTEARAAGILA